MNFVCKFPSAPAKALQNFFHFFLWLVALYLFFAGNSHAAPLPPSADNPLKTQAEVSFYIAENPLQIRILSNIVSVSVRPVAALEFVHATEVRVQSGRLFSIPLLLVNRGNVVTPYTLKLKSDLDDSPVLLLDADGNGRKDDGDVAFDMKQPRYLKYAGHDALLLTGTVPPGIAEGTPYAVEVSARVAGTNVIARARLTLSAGSAPQAAVTLKASRRVLDTGDATTLTARIVNSGRQALQMAKSIMIDGTAHRVTLLRYRIPAGMRYVENGAAQAVLGPSATLLFAAAGDADFHYRTQAGADDIAEIAVAIKSALRPKEGLDLRFKLRLGDDADGPQIASHAEAFDDASLLAAASNIVIFDMARNDSPDIVPRIVQRDTDLGSAATRADIHVENIGVSAAEGTISMRGEVPAIIADGDIGGANWQCTVARSTAGSAFECSNRNRLPAGGSTPPISINIANSESGSAAGSCGPDKKIGVVVSVPNEAQGLTGNNRAEVALMCKNGAAISGRAWIDAANNGIYTADQDGLSGWTAQLMREGKVIKEATTDRQGRYRITGIAPDGGYSLRFLSPQGRIEAPPLASRDGSGALVIRASRDFVNGTLVYHEPLAPREYPDQDLALLPTGIIFDAQTAQPLANARVTLAGPKGFVPHLHLVGPGSNVVALTDDKGRYNFFLTPDAPAGLYHWKVEAEGYATPEDEAVLELGEVLGVTGPDEVRLAYKVFNGTGIPSFSDSDETPNPPPDTRARRLLKAAPESLSAPAPSQRRNGYLAMSRVQGARKLANNHLGLFPVSGSGGLYLEKTADRKAVEIIDMFHYRIKVGHSQATTYNGFVINDSLPRGLRYVSGSARLLNADRSGSAFADPVIEQGADGGATNLRFDFPDIALQSNLPVEISYRVAVGATVAEGARLISYASVSAGRQSAQGAAAVRIVGGVFSNDAFVLGKVFLDCNGDRLQGADEPGVPGVRIYLEDGSFAETDGNGNYSLYGLAPLTHVLKMDATTLPTSARSLALSSRNAGRGDSRFLDLRNGELGRGDFALSCSDEILAEVTYRRQRLADAGDELDSALRLRFDAEAKLEERQQITPGSRASGVIGDRAGAASDVDAKAAPEEKSAAAAGPAEAGMLPPSQAAGGHRPPAPPDNAEKRKNLDALLRGDATLRIVNLSNGQIMPGDFADVTVRGSNAADFILKVNGAAVSAQQIGQRSELPSRKAAVSEYIAVRLRSGRNTIAVEQCAGADLQRHEIEVIVPGPPVRIEITAPQHLFADGKSAVALGIHLYDSAGLPATASDMVSLRSDLGSWITPDADPDEDGLQVLIRDGKATVLLKAPPEAGSAELSVEHGMLRQTQRLQFEPALRPMIAAGIFEGVVTLNNGKIEMAGGSGNNGFERELRTFSRRSANGKREAAGRAALFLKGQIKGEYLLTAAFDSDKESRQRLFRDIEPDKYYPVYGDDSIRGFDAQASSKLYLRVDKGRSYLLYGDFNTAEASQMRQLTQYSRAVNGIRHHFEKGPFSGNFFASHDNLRQQVIKFRAANTRFYPGKLPPSYVEGSERVELITYDRSQRGIGQRIKALSRYVDYTIEDLSGSFIVTKAETSNDPETGGENFYRIVFEVEEGAEQSWLYGGDVTLGTAGKLRVGATAVNDDNPNQPRRLQGLFGSWQVGQDTEINGEYAWTYLGQDLIRNASSDLLAGNGSGWRVGAKHSGAKLQSEWSALKTSPAYSNLSAPVTGGRFEVRAKGVYRIDKEMRIKSEALRTQDKLAGDGTRFGSRLDDNGLAAGGDLSYSGLLLGVERDLGPSAKAEIGTRIVRGAINRAGAAEHEQPIDLLTLRTRVSSAVPGLPKVSVYGEYEQDVRAQDKRALALGADYALSEKGRVYARHELISSLGSAYEIEENSRSYRTLVGIEGDYMKGGRAFSEYRGARPLTERGPETAYGTRNSWRISDKLNVRSSFERTRSVSGASGQERQSEATTLSSVFEYRHSKRLKGATGLDVRFGDSDTSYLYTLGVGYRLDENWTMLGKSAMYWVHGRGDSADARVRDTLRSRQRIGLAYRQTQGNRLNALAYYEHRHMRGGDEAVDKENTHIFSTHANFQPARRWTLSGRYAAKYKTMGGINGNNGIHGHLVSGRVTRDIGRYWDAGLAAAVFADSFGQRRQAYGVEVGHQLQDDLWLSAGYNVVGFVDRDFSGMAETGQGLYFRIRYKFDENSF